MRNDIATRHVTLRPATPADAEPCGRIAEEAFRSINTKHGFPPDFPNPDAAISLLTWMTGDPQVYGVVAEANGRTIGSNFLWLGSSIAGVGPITVEPTAQNGSVGRQLMEDVLRVVDERGLPGVRLVQAAFHTRSLSLYAKLGFDIREPLASMQGNPLNLRIPGYDVRPGTPDDVAACDALCRRVHGHDRPGEVRHALAQGALSVVEHDGRITGYTTGVAFFAHSVGETDREIMALIGAAPAFGGPGFLLPIRNGELFRWCLAHGLRVVHTMNLMSKGLYNEPRGGFLPSVLY